MYVDTRELVLDIYRITLLSNASMRHVRSCPVLDIYRITLLSNYINNNICI